MADPQAFLRVSANFFKRNNPMQAFLVSMATTIENLATFMSKRKLLKYKFYLAQQHLAAIEHNLQEGNAQAIRGNKIDRDY
jgi:hypothetical protein